MTKGSHRQTFRFYAEGSRLMMADPKSGKVRAGVDIEKLGDKELVLKDLASGDVKVFAKKPAPGLTLAQMNTYRQYLQTLFDLEPESASYLRQYLVSILTAN